MRVNLRYALLGAVALVVVWYFWGWSRTPKGQPALTSLTPSNHNQFKDEFNNSADRIRLVLLLSPT